VTRRREVPEGRARRARALGFALCAAAWTASPACISKAPAHPPESGDCVETRDAECTDPGGPAVGGPEPGGVADGEAPDADAGSADLVDGASCGAASTLIVTANMACLLCIESQGGCCIVDQACSDSDCLDLMACTEACAAGDQTCIGNCENQWPDAVTTYDDFASCLRLNCSSSCPRLPQSTVPRDG
jgi:hypothetical protein